MQKSWLSSDSIDSDGWKDAFREDDTAMNGGIAIPSFLQPLLGLDFVPYLPGKSQLDTTSTKVTDELLDDLDLTFGPPASSNARHTSTAVQADSRLDYVSPGSAKEVRRSPIPRSASDPAALETFSSPATGEPSKEDAEKLQTTGRRRGNIINKVREKMGERRTKKKEQKRGRTGTWHGEGASPFKTKNDSSQNSLSHVQWIQEQNLRLLEDQSRLQAVHLEAQLMTVRANEIYHRIGESQKEIIKLRKALAQSEDKVRRDLNEFDETKTRLQKLQRSALNASRAVVESIQQMNNTDSRYSNGVSGGNIRPSPPESEISELSLEDGPNAFGSHAVDSGLPPLRPRAASAPMTLRIDSFMRVDDLGIESEEVTTSAASSKETDLSAKKHSGLIFVDHHITPILQKLSRLGYEVAIDESSRFVPTKDTERLLSKYKNMSFQDNILDHWPIKQWKAAHEKDILVWTGNVGHSHFGSDWPVVKARCLVKTSPRSLIDFMMDSSRIKEYNKMSQGREDLLKIQEGLDTTERESLYGFAGDCKIVKALNKPKLIPKTIETLSLMYSQPLSNAPPGSYMIVTRSVFENDSGEHKSPSANTIRSEMLLGVTVFRPANAKQTVTEMTNITHVFSPGVPEMLARRVAPSSALNVLREIQNVFVGRND